MKRHLVTASTALLLMATSACSVFDGDHHKQALQPEQAVEILHTRISDLKTGMPVFKSLKKRDGLSSQPCDDGPGETNGPVAIQDDYGMPYPSSKHEALATQFEDFLKARGWKRAFKNINDGITVSMTRDDDFGIVLNLQSDHAYVDATSSCVKDPGYAFLKSHS